MECPDCRRLRHVGDCEPYMSDMEECEMDHDLEMLQMDAEQANLRFFAALEREYRSGRLAQEERRTP